MTNIWRCPKCGGTYDVIGDANYVASVHSKNCGATLKISSNIRLDALVEVTVIEGESNDLKETARGKVAEALVSYVRGYEGDLGVKVTGVAWEVGPASEPYGRQSSAKIDSRKVDLLDKLSSVLSYEDKEELTEKGRNTKVLALVKELSSLSTETLGCIWSAIMTD